MSPGATLALLGDGTFLVHEVLGHRAIQALEIRVSAGADNDPASHPGTAHLVEHLILRRSTDAQSSASGAKSLEQWGLRPAALTGPDFTSFTVICPEQHSARALQQLMAMVRRPDFSPETVVAEQRVIDAELASQASDPTRLMVEYAHSAILGGFSSWLEPRVDAFSARSFWEEFYRSPRISIVACGPTRDLGLDVLDASDSLCEGAAVTRASCPDPSLSLRSLHCARPDGRAATTHLLSSFPIRDCISNRRAVANVLAAVLGGGFSSYLVRELRINRQLAYSPRSFYSERGGFGMVHAFASVAEADRSTAGRVMRSAMRRLADDDDFATHVQTAKAHLCTGTLIAHDDLGKRVSAMARLWQRERRLALAEVIASINEVTTDAVRGLMCELASLPADDTVYMDKG